MDTVHYEVVEHDSGPIKSGTSSQNGMPAMMKLGRLPSEPLPNRGGPAKPKTLITRMRRGIGARKSRRETTGQRQTSRDDRFDPFLTLAA